MASSSTSIISKDSWLRAFMEKHSLLEDGSNFQDWEANLRLAAQADGKERFLTQLPPPTPTARVAQAVRNSYDEYQLESALIKNVLI